MKRIRAMLPLALITCLMVFAFVGSDSNCGDRREDVLASVTIIDQPEGGTNVNTVSCTFEASMTRTDGKTDVLEYPVRVNSIWHSSHGTYNAPTLELYFPGQPQRHTVSKSAPAGMHLDKPFWLEIFWYDKDGNNTIYSDTAYCE